MENTLNYKELKASKVSKKQGCTLDYTQLRLEYQRLKREQVLKAPKKRRIVK